MLRGVGQRAWRHQARIRFHAPLATLAELIEPEGGILTPDGDDACVLETGTDSLRDLVTYLTRTDVAFTVLDPPELREVLSELARRYLSAAGAPPPTPRAGGEPA
ncbi:hypothetical protein Phou_012460 [Phytohabitans houttuyneae]|uniref:WCX domain-containing protein n=1 Tax=Phytohabitans houttuyneae TaxID=1076126 RepID=A0A6V8K4Z5_9ACTN|nr:hypothetical protein Phou_012460 [Phytohabitans houttuyneae]